MNFVGEPVKYYGEPYEGDARGSDAWTYGGNQIQREWSAVVVRTENFPQPDIRTPLSAQIL